MKIVLITLGCISLAFCFFIVVYLILFITASYFYNWETNESTKEEEYIEPLVISFNMVNGEESLKRITEEVNRRVKIRLDNRIDRVSSIFISKVKDVDLPPYEAKGQNNSKFFITIYYTAKTPFYQYKAINGFKI